MPGKHRKLSIRRVRPLLPRTINIELHSVAIGIAQVKRLAHAMIGSTLKPDTGCNQPLERICQGRSCGIDDCMMIKPSCAERRRCAVQAFPCIQSNVMVITAGRKERSLVAHALHQLKAKHATIETDGTLQVSYFQVYMANPNLRINRCFLFWSHKD